jgi:recombination protein RecA
MPASTRAFTSKLNKILGEDVIIPAEDLVIPRRYTSGSLALDVILGGGFPGNQWTEIIGLESSGKTATLLKMIAANQRLDPDFTVLWVAGEHFDSEQAEALGVDLTRVDIARTQAMEPALQIMVEATSSHEYDCIILDSYPALLSADEDGKGMDEFSTATGARLLNKFIRKAGPASQRKADGSDRPFFGVIINQWRDQIGGFSRFGPPKTTPGGKGKNYFFYTRIEVSRIEWITEKRPGIKDPFKVGQVIKYLTVKNKSAAPQQTATVDFYFRAAPYLGFSRGDYDVGKEYVDTAMLLGVVERAGAYYRFNGDQWQGKDALLASVREDLDLREAIQKFTLEMAADPKALDRRQDG